jgi:MYXO-CTERM domain-containing protein
LTALLRRANGQVLVSALDVVNGALYRSTDGGESFVRMPSTLSIRAMAERSGTIYAAADYFADGFALGVSRDDGLTFQPLMTLDQVAGTRTCGNLPSTCAPTCDMLVALNVFKASTCRGAPGGADGGAGGVPRAAAAGCGCGVGAAATPGLGVAALILITRRPRRRRH